MREVMTDGVDVSGRKKEELVTQIRYHLRLSEQKHHHGDKAGAACERKIADELLTVLANTCAKTMQRYAWAFFDGDSQRDVRDDAIAHMTLKLVEAVRDLSGSNELYERRFNLCFRYDCFEAISSVSIQNGYSGHQYAGKYNLILESTDDSVSLTEDDVNQSTIGDLVPDPNALEAYGQVVSTTTLEQELGRLAPVSQRVVKLRLKLMPWPEIAACCGISEKTARNYFRSAAGILVKRIAVVEGSDSEG